MKFGKILCGSLAVLLLITSAPMTSARTGAVDSSRTATNSTPDQTATNPTPGQTASDATPGQDQLAKPVVTLETREAAVKVSYKAVAGADKYEISYSKDASFKSARTEKITKTYFTIYGLQEKATYYVRVRAWKGKEHSDWSDTKSAKAGAVKVEAVSGLKLTAQAKKIGVSFQPASGVKGYEVQYSTKRDMTTAKTVQTKKTNLTINRLKAKKTYYVRVRSYKTINGVKYYSKWTSKMKTTTK